jgi:hypothetical protein
MHLVKERLGLNPLLVCYNKYFNTALGIRNLANLRIRFDCDILIKNVNPISVKRITRTTLREFGSMYWHCLAGHSVFPVQTAVQYRIPLIIWGAHQGLEQVGMFSHTHEVEMTRRYRKDHDLMGREADDLLSIFDTLNEEDIWQYRYPDDTDIRDVGVRGIYLGNYVRWDPKVQHELMIDMHDYRTSSFDRTFDCYDHVDCYNFMGLHDHLKLIKHGYSKVTDHACREIRHGRLSREQGQALVAYHQVAQVKHRDLFCEWLGIKNGSLDFIINQHRNPTCWKMLNSTDWEFIGPLAGQPNDESARGSIDFRSSDTLEYTGQRGYITVGKGFP